MMVSWIDFDVGPIEIADEVTQSKVFEEKVTLSHGIPHSVTVVNLGDNYKLHDVFIRTWAEPIKKCL